MGKGTFIFKSTTSTKQIICPCLGLPVEAGIQAMIDSFANSVNVHFSAFKSKLTKPPLVELAYGL